MTVYYGLLAIIFIANTLYRDERNRKKFLIIVFFTLFLIMALRNASMVGDDSSTSYYQNFLDFRLPGTKVVFDNNIAFSLFQKIVFDLTGNYQIFIIVQAAFVCYSYYRLIFKYSVNPYISVMWYIGMLIYLFLFSALKQAMAMAVLCYAFDAMMEGKEKKFYITVVIAALFHTPALVFLPAYRISKIKNGRNYLFLLLLITLTCFVFRKWIVVFIGSLYRSYDQLANNNVSFTGTKTLFMFLTIIIALSVRKIDFENDRMYSSLQYFMGIAMIFQMFCFYSNSFERLANYYYHFSILFIPLILEKNQEDLENKRRTLVGSLGTIVVTLFCICYFLSYLSTGAENLTPFYFFWEGNKIIIISR